MKAFPASDKFEREDRKGMDLRDYFAAKAMQSLIHSDDEALSTKEDVAVWAYEFADVMMIARGQG